MRYAVICAALMLSSCGPMYANTAYPMPYVGPVYRPMQLPATGGMRPLSRSYSVFTPGGGYMNCTDYGNGNVTCF